MTRHTHQLVMQFASDGIADYDSMVELEDRLNEGLGNDHDVDGHDVGSGEINIFIHTNDPNVACDGVRDLLSDSQQKTVKIAFRAMDSEEYTVLWPLNETSFTIA